MPVDCQVLALVDEVVGSGGRDVGSLLGLVVEGSIGSHATNLPVLATLVDGTSSEATAATLRLLHLNLIV